MDLEANLKYADKNYWEMRFETEKDFEWLTNFDEYGHLILPYLNRSSRILHIGCGSSQLSMQLCHLGYTNITNLDFSETIINRGKKEHPHMEWICDDIKSLEKIDSESFDIVIEKATLEVLLVAERSPWEPTDDALRTLDCVFSAVSRVLKPGGIYLSLSFTQPHFRIPCLLRHPKWGICHVEFGSTFHFYLYVMQLGEKTLEETRRRFSSLAPSWLRVLNDLSGGKTFTSIEQSDMPSTICNKQNLGLDNGETSE